MRRIARAGAEPALLKAHGACGASALPELPAARRCYGMESAATACQGFPTLMGVPGVVLFRGRLQAAPSFTEVKKLPGAHRVRCQCTLAVVAGEGRVVQ